MNFFQILDVMFDSKFTFERHIHSISSSVAQKIGLLRKSFRIFGDDDVLLRCFNSFILPCLEYCSPVWFSAADFHLKLLDKNLRACKFLIPNITISLQHRRLISSLCMLYVTSPLQESRLLWIHDPHPRQPPRVPPRVSETADKVPRNNNIVPRNNPVTQSSDARVRSPLENIASSTWYNSALSSRSSDCQPVPRNNITDSSSEQHKTVSRPPKKKRNRQYRRERRARERAERGEVYNHDARWAAQRSGDPPHSSIPAQVIQSGLQDSDPISAMRPAVYYPRESVGSSRPSENSPFQIGPDAGESPGLRPGLYKTG